MLRSAYRKPPIGDNKFLNLVRDYWFVILGLILVLPPIIKYLKFMNLEAKIDNVENQIKDNDSQNLSPVTQLVGMNKITTNVAYHEWARSLAYHFGTLQGRSWWSFVNPSTWTENDKDIYDLLKQANNTGQKRIITELYFFLTSRNLADDIQKYLDNEFKIKLPLWI